MQFRKLDYSPNNPDPIIFNLKTYKTYSTINQNFLDKNILQSKHAQESCYSQTICWFKQKDLNDL